MRKQRNGEIVKPVQFRLLPVELGKDEDGETATSCTVAIGAAGDFEPLLTHEQQEWVDQLRAYEQTIQESAENDEPVIFTHKVMQRAWAQPEEAESVLSPKYRSLSIEGVKKRSVLLKEIGALERVSKENEKPMRYKLAVLIGT